MHWFMPRALLKLAPLWLKMSPPELLRRLALSNVGRS
jgi:hypothetical protein